MQAVLIFKLQPRQGRRKHRPVGAALVLSGDSQNFTITPEFCYEITDVLVDSVSICAPNCLARPPTRLQT